MNITIFGANGSIGKMVVQEALNNGDHIVAYVRRDNALTITHKNLEIIVGNLDNETKIQRAVVHSDAVISALGPSLDKSRKIKELPITLAHKTIIKVMEKLNKTRFITLATPTIKAKEDKSQIITTLPSIMAKILFPTAYQEMKQIEPLIKKSSLDWTVVRIINPNVKFKGQSYDISFGNTKGKMNVSRENAAKCLYDSIRNNAYIHKMPIVFNNK